ncbi:MAG: gamma-glutamylcyclotransferase [Rhodospirillales bacterium]|nr:gamma-glutamylcyclotransferase [Rhodospirillales bacterium]
MTDGDTWVFAYGSLMWRPGFDYLEESPARLYGYHRGLCVYSNVYRGTPEKPGLVLGLDRGGSCLGRAFRVAAGHWQTVRDYLYAREMINDVYRPTFLKVRLEDGRRLEAYAFVARRDHVQYTGHLSPEQMLPWVLQGHGKGGSCLDYVENTIAHLDEMGIPDGPLHKVLTLAKESIG